MSTEPADEQPNPRTIPRPPSHPSGGLQEPQGPFGEPDCPVCGARAEGLLNGLGVAQHGRQFYFCPRHGSVPESENTIRRGTEGGCATSQGDCQPSDLSPAGPPSNELPDRDRLWGAG